MTATVTIAEAASMLAERLDIPTPEGESSADFRLRFARALYINDLAKELVRLAGAGALRLRYPDGGHLPAGASVSDSSQVDISEAQAALEGNSWSFVAAETAPREQTQGETKVNDSLTWQERAQRIADELFDRDTESGCRDTLANYSARVMEEMQKREIHGPRGRIDNPATIQKEALQGKKWWAHKAK